MRGVLVLDLDGTVILGDTPVLAYARAVEACTPRATGLTERVVAFLAAPGAHPALVTAQDGYQAVQLIAESVGIDDVSRNAAYARSRAGLAEDLGDVRTPTGLADLLATLPVHRAVVTNSPADGLDALLKKLGLTTVLDEVRGSAGKPAGLPDVLGDLLSRHGLEQHPHRLLSVGDIWVNDLAPALGLGCATAYVDALDRRQGPAHVRGRSLPDLYDHLTDWAHDPEGFVAAHPAAADAAVPARPGRAT